MQRPNFRRGTLGALTLVLSLMIMASVPCFSQSSFGSLVGNTSDETGAAIPGAKVIATNIATSESRTTTSTSSGDYQLFIPPSGRILG